MRRKIFGVLIPLVLILGIFSKGVMAEVCFCGQSCLHGPGEGSEARKNFPFHNRCSGGHCKSCNIEEGQTLKTANTSSPTGNVKIFDTTCTASLLIDYPSTIHNFQINGSSYACITVPSLPIYLKTLSLLI
jgi:hypothetical protein